MYKIEYRNPDGTGIDGTDPWVSDPVPEERLEAVLEKMRVNGCSIVNVIDMGESVYFTKEEIRMLHIACVGYGDKLSQIIKCLPRESAEVLDGLVKAAEYKELAAKISGYMENAETQKLGRGQNEI